LFFAFLALNWAVETIVIYPGEQRTTKGFYQPNAMNRLVLLIITLYCANCYAQQTSIHNKVQFKIVEYINGNVYREKLTTVDTVDLTKRKMDLYFLREHFNTPYYLPHQFINNKYKNETIVDTLNYRGDKNFSTIQIKTFKYDSLSRVVNYSDSSCPVCNYLSYEYKVTYNQRGQVEAIVSSANERKSYKIYYDSNGNIKQLDYLLFDKLDMQIIMQ
jgi:hypothetical protein